jgi:hypothetical protein
MGATTDPIKAAQAMALGDMGYPSTQVAERTGLPQRTAWDIINRIGHWGQIAVEKPVFAQHRYAQNEALEVTARALAAKFWVHAEDNIEKLAPYQAVIAGSILIDKAQLLAGLPTEITASVNVQVEGRIDELVAALGAAMLLKRAEARTIDITPNQAEPKPDNR